MIINMIFATYTRNFPKVLFHKTMAFVVRLLLTQFLPHALLLFFPLKSSLCSHGSRYTFA